MAAVWLSRFSRWLEALNNAKGGAVLVDIEPSLRAVALIQEGNEDRYLQGWNRYGFSVFVAAVAANFGQAQIRNPAGSNVVIVVEELLFGCASGLTDFPTLTWGATVSDLASVPALTFTRVDPRGNPQPTAIISSTTGGSNLAVFQQVSLPAGSTFNFIQSVNCEYTVLPGQILKIFGGVANQNVTFSWLWRERPLQTSELT